MSLSLASSLPADNRTVWISGSGSGIYRSSFDPESGRLSPPELAAEFTSGSWIAFHPTLAVLYSSIREGDGAGVVSFEVGPDAGLTRQSVVFMDAGSPTHLAISPDGALLATSHYGDGVSGLFGLNPDGSLRSPGLITPHTLDEPGPHERQGQSRPHFAVFTPDGTRVHQVDLGTNEIWTFQVKVEPLGQTFSHKVRLPAGYGPRHLSFHPSMRFAYVSDELGAKISALRYDESTAVFTPIEHLDARDMSVAEPYNNTSHILVHPNGRFVYIGNRGNDSIGVFSIHDEDGRLTLVEAEPARAHWPRNFTIDPSGRWLLVAGARSGTVGVMAIDPETGELTFQLDSVVQVPTPVCLQFR